MKKKIRNFLTKLLFETPILGHLAYKIADKLDTKQEKEEFRQRVLNQPMTVQVSEKNVLAEGVAALKRGMRANMHLFGSGRNYGEAGFDLLGYTPGQNQNLADSLTKTTDLTGHDWKTEEEKNAMIETRIGHYKQLQNDKVKRDLIRQIRNEKDPQVKQELEATFQKNFIRRGLR